MHFRTADRNRLIEGAVALFVATSLEETLAAVSVNLPYRPQEPVRFDGFRASGDEIVAKLTSRVFGKDGWVDGITGHYTVENLKHRQRYPGEVHDVTTAVLEAMPAAREAVQLYRLLHPKPSGYGLGIAA